MQERILRILEENGAIDAAQIAVMLDTEVGQVCEIIDDMKRKGIILKYKALIDWEKTGSEVVTAYIELRVTPQRGEGFDKIAERVYQYPEVKSVYLMSGSYDLAVVIEGQNMKNVALFVAEKLAPMENVVSTKTHFILKKYKEDGVVFESERVDERVIMG